MGPTELSPFARTRLLGMIEAVNGQVEDIGATLPPLFPRDPRRAARTSARWRRLKPSMPYLVSKLSGRGKIEWVLTFAATKS